MRTPLVAGHGRTDVRRLVGVRLVDDDGVCGYGEAAPLPSYDGVTAEDVVEALEAWEPAGPLPSLPQAAAAIDLAQWDLRGRREGRPVFSLLGAGVAPVAVPVNATIGAQDPDAAGAAARAAWEEGFACVKVKVGVGDDVGRVGAVRAAAGPAMAIRLDANGAWTVTEALDALEVLAPFGIELCEEPVHGAAGLAQVAGASSMPIAADESVVTPGLLDERACAAVCLKIAASGGISGVLRDADRARAAGYEVYLASTLDGPLGIAAALHAAAVIKPDRPCGLATLPLLELDDPLPARAGRMAAPSAPGLGVEPF